MGVGRLTIDENVRKREIDDSASILDYCRSDGIRDFLHVLLSETLVPGDDL